MQVPVVLQPSAWWQHAIGAVQTERRDLLQQEAKPQLNATQQWHVRQQYVAAYRGVQTRQHRAAHWLGSKAWREENILQVWAFADIPYLPGDFVIHLIKGAALIYIQGQGLSTRLINTFVAWHFRQQCRVRRIMRHICSCCGFMPCLHRAQEPPKQTSFSLVQNAWYPAEHTGCCTHF